MKINADLIMGGQGVPPSAAIGIFAVLSLLNVKNLTSTFYLGIMTFGIPY